MNQAELVFLIISEGFLIIYLQWIYQSWKVTGFLVLIALLPLCLSLESCSQFLTVDEITIIKEPLQIFSSDLSQWSLGALRTTDVLIGPIGSLLNHLFPETTDIQAKILFKNLHWITGLFCLLWIHYLLDKLFVAKPNRKLFFIAYIYTALLLPTNNLALKIFNYDLLSMLLGVLAILYIILTSRYADSKYAVLSIILAFLAAQEKLISSPVLILAVASYGSFQIQKSSKSINFKLLNYTFTAFAIALAVGFISAIEIAILRNWNVPENFWWSPFDPLISWTWVVMRFLLNITNFKAYTLQLFGLTFIVSFLISLTLACIRLHFLEHPALRFKITQKIWTINNILSISVLLIGILSTFLVDAYWAPFFPINSSLTPMLGNGINGIVLHFNSATIWQHQLFAIGYAYAVFVNAIPTTYWIVIFSLLTRFFLNRNQKIELSLELLLLISFLTPMAIALLQIPVAHRYMNTTLLLVTTITIIKMIGIFTATPFCLNGGEMQPPRRKQSVLHPAPDSREKYYTNSSMIQVMSSQKKTLVTVALLVGILTLEIFPFKPLLAPFRPVWSHYDDSNIPILGKINPSWLGWGEELMLAGKRLKGWCRASGNNTIAGISCRSITLYTLYGGEWLEAQPDVHSQLFDVINNNQSSTNANYYVINRSAVVQGHRFPSNVQPEFTISFRGYNQAWIFRGDRLANANFHFNLKPSIH